MDQRRKLCVIACSNNKYRCLAAVHSQWIYYGFSAARQCLEILKVFSSNLNRIALQEELKLASAYDVEFWERGSRADDSNSGLDPCFFPFVVTCLYIGAGFEQTRGCQRVHVEPWLMKYDEGDKNYDGEIARSQVDRKET